MISPTFRLRTLQDDPCHTLLVQEDGKALYQTATDQSTTTIRRVSPSGEKLAVVGTIEWRKLSSHYITFGAGTRIKLYEFLRRTGLFTKSRSFTASCGTKYTWQRQAKVLELHTETASTPIATYRASLPYLFKFFPHDNDAYLEVSSEGIPILDTIVVTWVSMERARKKAEPAPIRPIPTIFDVGVRVESRASEVEDGDRILF